MGQETPKYFMPSEADKKRLARQHELIKDAMGGRLILAPIDLTQTGLKVLDSGTSDGFWISDFMKDHPAVQDVVGTDIDTTRFPKDLPKGVSLLKQDMREPWPAEWKESFDLVHQRLVFVASGGDPQPYANRLFDLVKHGGWVQLLEADQSIGEHDGPAMKQFMVLMETMISGHFRTPFYFAKDMSRYLREAGFMKVGEMIVPLSYGAASPTPELVEQSVVSFCTSINGLVGFAKNMPNIEGISKEELETLPARFEKELREQGAYYPMRVVWGQKPPK